MLAEFCVVRRALCTGLITVPAVALLDGVGASRLNARIAQAGGTLVLPKGETPGLAMALGGLGIKLSDLTMLYAGLARGGNAVPLTERMTETPPAAPRRLLDPVGRQPQRLAALRGRGASPGRRGLLRPADSTVEVDAPGRRQAQHLVVWPRRVAADQLVRGDAHGDGAS